MLNLSNIKLNLLMVPCSLLELNSSLVSHKNTENKQLGSQFYLPGYGCFETSVHIYETTKVLNTEEHELNICGLQNLKTCN
jgi:hypothetical protein